MKTWRIRIKKTGGDDRDFAIRPRLRDAARALQEARSSGRWGLAALFGLYRELWERKYRRGWSYYQSARTASDLLALLERVGPKEATKAVYAIFDAEGALQWVGSDQSTFLASKSNYYRFVVPALAAKRGGEQAEWDGERGSAGSEEVHL